MHKSDIVSFSLGHNHIGGSTLQPLRAIDGSPIRHIESEFDSCLIAWCRLCTGKMENDLSVFSLFPRSLKLTNYSTKTQLENQARIQLNDTAG